MLRLREVRLHVQALLVALATLGLVLLLATFWMLRSSTFAILRNEHQNGPARETRVWYAENDGELWIEAASPEREFLEDLRANPTVVLIRDGVDGVFHAEIVDTSEAREHVRGLLRAQYGWRDIWVELFTDPSQAVPVRLTLPKPVQIPGR